MYSLRRRLLICATIVLLLFLGIMAVALNNTFKQSVLSNAEDALRNQILLLISNVDVIDGKIVAPDFFSEPRLSQMDSNLFAQISSNDQEMVWSSPSLLDDSLPVLSAALGDFVFYEKVEWLGHSPIFSMSLSLEWETEQGDVPFTVQVAEHSSAYLQRLTRYQRTFGAWLAVMAAVLLLLLLLLLGWALKPLNRVAMQVSEIEEGTRQRFDEDYPREVSRLTQNLNQLLNFDEQRINRQKEVLGNLAHSLKTPIAVMRGLEFNNLEATDSNKTEADTQLGIMQNIIDYQLQSASTVGRRRFTKPVDVRLMTEQIINSLNKLHQGKSINVTVDLEPNVLFYGDDGDWMELSGNLLDNAFKWAASSVTVRVTNVQGVGADSNRLATRVVVEDDGPGIDVHLKENILQRGVRLDSQTPGHGLGMHIVKGIVDAYDGELLIDHRPTGGTCFTVLLN